MKKYILLLIPFFFLSIKTISDWGFFGHRRINRMAVFTLPPDMMVLYKKNIEYLTEHAVDPDKRRYSTKHEAVRHYIDLDHWGEYPFKNVPHKWTDALLMYTDIFVVTSNQDTIKTSVRSFYNDSDEDLSASLFTEKQQYSNKDFTNLKHEYKSFYIKKILPQYYEEEWVLDCEDIKSILPQSDQFDCSIAYAEEHFSEYGIVPYHLIKMQKRLTKAFEDKDIKAILRHSADFGHYIGDAHVPLHTTENYNGQFTNQVGIHGFWESRIPELFADETYDYFVGKADYIKDPVEYYWDVVLKSHTYVDSLLAIERDLRLTFPSDQQTCFEERLDAVVETQCAAFAAAYQEKLKGQVEARMRAAIHTVGSAWYTAWVDAGQPNLENMSGAALSEEEKKKLEKEEAEFRGGNIFGRQHDQ